MANNKILSGKLQEISLTDLLQNLISSKTSGTLTLRSDRAEKSIYIKEGHIVFASSNLSEDRLGHVLIHTGKMTPEQVEGALKLKGATNRKFGAVVVELGFLPPKELFEGLKLQVKEIIYSLFRWEDGDYRFTPGELPPEIVPLVLDPIQLISEIINRLQAGPVDGA
jgi:two-component system, OmpR family, response regulator